MYNFLLAPFIAFLTAQGIKFILKARQQKMGFKDFFAYSNMPSGHTAVAMALATIIFLMEGISSPLFAIAIFFASIVITDAVGLRTYLGQHGKTLNILVEDMRGDQISKNSYPKLLEQIGHKPIEAIAGGLIGVIIGLVVWLV